MNQGPGIRCQASEGKVQYNFFPVAVILIFILLMWGVLLFLIPSAYADVSTAKQPVPYLNEHARGWFWYELTPPKVKKKKAAKKKKEEVFVFPPRTMVEEKREIKAWKARAVMNPTEKNLVAYIRLQNWVMQQANIFSVNWKKVIWTHPELDFSQSHPVNSNAIFIKQDAEDLYDRQRIRKLGKDYGLFFIFKSSCPYCEKLAPMLKYFSRDYDMSIIPISYDGAVLSDFPNPRPDHGVTAQLGVRSLPALFLVNPKKRIVIPLAYELISETQLVHRIIIMTRRTSKHPAIRPGEFSTRSISYSHGGTR